MKTEPASALPECIEGPEAFERFDKSVRGILSVPRSTIVRRERAYRRKVASNPNRPGPKRKVKNSASPGPAV
jgi:hypothetical protein